MRFQNEDAVLQLDVAGYEFPAGAGDPAGEDRNWLVLRCTWRDGDDLVKDSNSCLLTYELREMTAGLKVLRAGIRPAYVSDFSEPFFALSVREAEGGYQAEASFYLPNTMDGNDTAEISAPMTGEELTALIGELEKLCEKYPERT